ncbi:MAG: protein-L-isoaspartate(D-aspartate) O-methyltransferase [Chloroflexi bacterium]|nr:protein-L-isoaspartate(D-aspartate) O-methyltransferase [Chloroflexota bacterium]
MDYQQAVEQVRLYLCIITLRGAQVNRLEGLSRLQTMWPNEGIIEREERDPAMSRPALRAILMIAASLFAAAVPGCAAGPQPLPTTFPIPSAQASRTASASATPPADSWTQSRLAMVRDQIQARGVANPLVLRAMEKVPRHAFVPERYREESYRDYPLPIGEGQTISQPYIVALMTELIDPKPGDRVLEIGTGSGYQAAVLAEITEEVYSVEIIETLAHTARARLDALGYGKVHSNVADGYFGWEENAPYDAIVVTAAPDHIPQPLVGQLRDGGRLVIPVGPAGFFQTLWVVEKQGGKITSRSAGAVTFVPLTRR